MTTKSNRLLAACAAATFGAALGLTAGPAAAADIFTLKSATFADGQMMPKKAGWGTPNPLNLPFCVGENVSPELSWSNVPAGTKSFMILMLDPEGRGGTGLSHAVFYGIPPTVTGFAEGELSKPSDKYVAGKGLLGNTAYLGACPQPNVGVHHYVFALIATDFDPKELPPGLTREDITAKVVVPQGQPSHSKGTAGIVGRFMTPYPE